MNIIDHILEIITHGSAYQYLRIKKFKQTEADNIRENQNIIFGGFGHFRFFGLDNAVSESPIMHHFVICFYQTCSEFVLMHACTHILAMWLYSALRYYQ